MWGTVLGASAGAAVGLLLELPAAGAVILGVVGALGGYFALDRTRPQPRSFAAPTTEQLLDRPVRRRPPPRARPGSDAPLVDAVVPLLMEVARVDGPVQQSEVRVIRELFSERLRLDAAGLELVRLALKDALASPVGDLTTVAHGARRLLEPARRLMVLEALYELVLVDGEASRRELDAIRAIAVAFNISDEQREVVAGRFFGDAGPHLVALGLEPGASDEDIRSAYRRLAAENHPDRFATSPRAQADAAAERFLAVRQAYEELRKARGL